MQSGSSSSQTGNAKGAAEHTPSSSADMPSNGQSSEHGPPSDVGESPDSEHVSVQSLTRRVKQLELERDRLRKAKEELEVTLSGVLNSKSWRLTKGLRGVVELLRGLFPLFVFAARGVSARAMERIESLGGSRFRILEASSILSLDLNGKEIPSGATLFSAQFSSERGFQHAYLYFDYGGGFQADQRALIPLEDGKSNETLLRFHSPVRALRLDPLDSEGEFSLDDIRLRPFGSLQLLHFFFRKHILSVVGNPSMLVRRLKKAFSLYRAGGIAAIRVRLFQDRFSQDYAEWVQRYDQSDTDSARMKALAWAARGLEYQPLISVIMPTYNTPEEHLRSALESVCSQWYENWELCVADDCSTEPSVARVLEEFAQRDSRIRYEIREQNGHISKASNSALAMAKGEYVTLLDHDDLLRPHALMTVVSYLQGESRPQFIYSDEDKVTADGMRFNPHFKSGFNPTLLTVQNYICHLATIQRSLVEEVGGFREGFEGAQDWDLFLRCTEGIPLSSIVHIPHILYSWRVIEGSTAAGTMHKPYVLEAQQKSVREHLERIGREDACVSIRHDISNLEIVYPVPENPPLVSIIIPTRDRVSLLKQCVDSILQNTEYSNFELLIVDNESIEDESLEYFKQLQDHQQTNVRVIRQEGEFNFSRLNNFAVQEAKGELLALCNNDLETIKPDWLTHMVSYALHEENGAIGARLLYPNDLLQHGGIILGIGGVAGHNHKGVTKEDPGYFNRCILPQNLTAVTAACLVVRKELFEEVGGLDEGALSVAFNDVDFCLKLHAAGYKNVYLPQAELYHHESASRGYETTPEKFQRFEAEIQTMKERWGALLEGDPFYNANLTLVSEDFSLAFPPREPLPWRK